MNYRPLGNTGITVSEIGFGAWGIGGLTKGRSSYGPTDDDESKKALRAAFEQGITFYDTADIYGYGHSETLIGEALGLVREKIVIASKVGFLEHLGPQDFSEKHVRTSLEQSLKRLRTDYIDLYQLHDPDIDMLVNDPSILATFGAFQKEGKIRSVGISVKGPDEGVRVTRELNTAVIQINLNMIDHRAIENGLLDAAEKKEIGIIARTPLCFGFLSDRKVEQFHPRDHRTSRPPEQLERWQSAQDLFRPFNEGTARTFAQLALQFCLSFPAVSTVIPGMLKVSEVMENASASKLGPLNESELAQIYEIYKTHSFFAPNARQKIL